MERTFHGSYISSSFLILYVLLKNLFIILFKKYKFFFEDRTPNHYFFQYSNIYFKYYHKKTVNFISNKCNIIYNILISENPSTRNYSLNSSAYAFETDSIITRITFFVINRRL